MHFPCPTSEDFDTCYRPVNNLFLEKNIAYLGHRHPRSSEITIA